MIASFITNTGGLAYPLVGLIVMAESSGVPVPGETTLIAAAILASQGKLQIALVIALAAVGAIIGDNLGYLIGRKGGRWLLERPGPFQRQRAMVLERGEPLFERHGAKTVFIGRWLLGLRVWASWLAGANRMRWPKFLFWNAAGGIAWATSVGLLAFFLGHGAERAIRAAGIYGAATVVAVVVAGGLFLHLRHRRARARHPPEAG